MGMLPKESPLAASDEHFKMKRSFTYIGYGALGLAEGGLVSILPLPSNLLLIAILLASWPIALLRGVSTSRGMGHLIKMALAIAAVSAAMMLPVKHLDGQVGPMLYERISLDDLSRRLFVDWQISVTAYDAISADTFLTFRIDKPMSRRRVLEKLAQDTGWDLNYGYCGTGATILYGAYPSFTTLSPPRAK